MLILGGFVAKYLNTYRNSSPPHSNYNIFHKKQDKIDAMKKKISNIFRQTFTDTDGQDIKHEATVDAESQIKMAHAKKSWLMDY